MHDACGVVVRWYSVLVHVGLYNLAANNNNARLFTIFHRSCEVVVHYSKLVSTLALYFPNFDLVYRKRYIQHLQH